MYGQIDGRQPDARPISPRVQVGIRSADRYLAQQNDASEKLHARSLLANSSRSSWEQPLSMPPQLQATGSTDRPHDDRHKVEEVVGVAAEVLRTSALPPLHFTVGVLNAVLKAYLLGAVPQHFWLYTTFQFVPLMMMLVPRWKAKGNLLYFAELCWVINFTAWLYLALEATSAIFQAQPLLPTSIRLLLARAFWSLANGPLALTVLMNHNAIVFHDVERTASFFIHFSPALVTWTMRWAPGGARLFAIPNSALPTGLATNWDLIVTGLGAYSCWWVPYTIWLIVIGHSLPDQGWGNSSFKDMRPKISSREWRLQISTK